MLVLCLAAAVPWLGARVGSAVGVRERVYSLAGLESHLAHEPAAWLQRSVRTRALLGGQCTEIVDLAAACGASRMALIDPHARADSGSGSIAQPLPLAWGKPPALLAFLRRVPLVGQLLPRPQIVHLGVPAVYRIQVRPTACVLSADPPCYEALLLDAIAPDSSTDWVQIGS